MALQHLRSGTANKRPIPTAMSDGQLAVNTNLASPGLFFKDSNGDLVKAGPVHVGTTAPNASPASTAATALVANTIYQILTVGTSDFTAVGASANTVGTVFTATGTTTGTGTVSGQQGNEKGEQWLDTTNSLYVMKVYDGTGWRVTDSISLANGSAAAPSLHFGSDTNAGLFRSAADSLAITTAGTQRVTVDSSGKVGIGTSSPTRQLEIAAAGTSIVRVRDTSNSVNMEMLASSAGGWIGPQSAHSLNFQTGNTERMRIDSSGRLLLNGTTATGDNKLQIISSDASINSLTIGRGKNSVASNTALGDHALFTNTTGSNNTAVGLNTLYYVSTGSNNTAVGNRALQGNTGGNNTAVGASALFTNNVGSDNTAVGYYALLYNQSGNNNTAFGRYALAFNTTGSKNIGIGYTAGDAITTGSNNTIIGDIPGTATLSDTVIIGAGTAERLRIDSTGRVGIGQSSPTTKLEVAGDVKVVNTGIAYLQPNTVTAFQAYESSGPVKISLANNGSATFASNVGIGTTSANRKLVAEQANSTAYSSSDFDQDYHLLKLSNSTDSKSAGLQFGIGSNGEAAITATEVSDGATDLCFGTRGSGSRSEKVRITSDGKIGVGTSSPNAPLAVLATSSTYKGMELITPAGDGSGEFIFGVHQSGSSAGRNIVFKRGGTDGTASESMRLDSSGYLGLGTSSPQQTLHLKGTYLRIDDAAQNLGTMHIGAESGVNSFYSQAANAGAGAQPFRFMIGSSAEVMRLDSSGNVGINNSSPGSYASDARNLVVGSGSGSNGITIASGASNSGTIYFADGTSGASLYTGTITYNHSSNYMAFWANESERMRIDSNGKLVVGATSFLSGANSFTQAMISGGDGGLIINSTNTSATSYCRLMFTPNGHITGNEGMIRYNTNDFHFGFWTQGNERMRLNHEGALHIAKTAFTSHDTEGHSLHQSGWAHHCSMAGVTTLFLNRKTSGSSAEGNIIEFYLGGTYEGNIYINSSGITLNSISDYRVKENVIDITDGITRLKQLSPRRFNFIKNAGVTIDGFIAHEVETVVPEAVCGEKDGEEMQGMDHSRLVPLLTAALQEAIAKIETLETKVAALEAG